MFFGELEPTCEAGLKPKIAESMERKLETTFSGEPPLISLSSFRVRVPF